MAVVKVKSYNRNGIKVRSHTRDCTTSNYMKRLKEVAKMSNVRSPLSSGNPAVDKYVAKAVLPIKLYNMGFNLGKGIFIAEQTYNDVCRKK